MTIPCSRPSSSLGNRGHNKYPRQAAGEELGVHESRTDDGDDDEGALSGNPNTGAAAWRAERKKRKDDDLYGGLGKAQAIEAFR